MSRWFSKKKTQSIINECESTAVVDSTSNTKRTGYIGWDDFFMGTAFLAAMRSKDPNTQVGACVVNGDKKIVGIGYNGMPTGCNDDVFPWGKHTTSPYDSKYLYVCHAEMNAILNKNCVDLKGCTIYVALFPCNECAKLIIQSGIKNVIYYSDKNKDKVEVQAAKRMFKSADVSYKQYVPKTQKIENIMNIGNPGSCLSTMKENMRAVYEKGKLFDVVLVSSDGEVWNCHKLVLIASCPAFERIFLNMSKWYEINHITVPASSLALKSVVEYLYYGECRLDALNISEVIAVANKLEFSPLVFHCCAYLINQMQVKRSVIDLYFRGFSYFADAQRFTGWRIITDNFQTILTSPEFLETDPSILSALLASDYLTVDHETEVAKAIIKWIEHDRDQRIGFAPLLLHCIRYGLMTRSFVRENLLAYPYFDTEAKQVIFKGLKCHDWFLLGDPPVSPFSRHRFPHEFIFAVNGWSSESPVGIIETYNKMSDEWSVVVDHSFPRAYHCAEFINHIIYLIGGYFNKEVFASVNCFDTITLEWYPAQPMTEYRCYATSVVLDEVIYVMGGFNGEERLNSAERYNPKKNRWERICPMFYIRSDACSAVHNGKIYVAGGVNDGVVLHSVEEYDKNTDTWRLIAELINPRTGASLVMYRNSLYIMGGSNVHRRLNTCERLSLENDGNEWVYAADMNILKSNFSAVVFNDCIYTMGGFDGITTIDSVEIFNENDEGCWSYEVPSMKVNRSALKCFVATGIINSESFVNTPKQNLHKLFSCSEI